MMTDEGELKRRVSADGMYELVRVDFVKEIIDEAKKDFPKYNHPSMGKKYNHKKMMMWVDVISNYIQETIKWRKKWFGDSS